MNFTLIHKFALVQDNKYLISMDACYCFGDNYQCFSEGFKIRALARHWSGKKACVFHELGNKIQLGVWEAL